MLTTFPPSYLYQQYADDTDLQALVQAQNNYAQAYLDQINNLQLPIYTNLFLSGSLLDWCITGIYGIARPVIGVITATTQLQGEYNSSPYNVIPINGFQPEPVQELVFSPANDDVYRRVTTWIFYKGDGKYFNVRWLKRRVMRFLTGANGTDPGISETYPVSVIFAGRNVTIRLPTGEGQVTGGALCNAFACNTVTPNASVSTFTPIVQPQDGTILQDALNSGIMPLPFQYNFTVQLT